MKNFALPLLLVFCISVNAQESLPYFSGFDNTAEKTGWNEFKKASTEFSHWGYSSFSSFSAPNNIGHSYSPSTGIGLTDNWMVSPPFVIKKGGTLDSIRYKFAGMSTPQEGDTIAVYLLQGSQDPEMASARILLQDFRDTLYQNDYKWKILKDINLPSFTGNSYIALRYRNTDCSTKWLTAHFDNIAINENNQVGIKNSTTEGKTGVFPNPGNGNFTITGSGIISVEVFNLSGKLISTLPNIGEAPELHLNLSNFPKGIYLLKIQTGSSSYFEKVLFQ